MSAAERHYELDLRLFRILPEVTQIELSFDDPTDSAERAPLLRTAALDPAALAEHRDSPEAYGRTLTAQLTSNEDVRATLEKALARAETGERLLRLRLIVDSSAAELRHLSWELLRDPRTDELLVTNEKVHFFRFLFSQDWRPVRLHRRAKLTAVIAAAVADREETDAEVERARLALGEIPATVAGKEQPLTLDRLMDQLRRKVDVLYLVCDVVLNRAGEPHLVLAGEEGKPIRVRATELAARLGELPEMPRLAVILPPLRRGPGGATPGRDPHGALASRLAVAGVPVVLALPGELSAETFGKLVPAFFTELEVDGQADRALALGRARARGRPDVWVPALYSRLARGRFWYDPGFGAGKGDDVK